MLTDAQFLFVVCQAGAERALKAELANSWPDFRFAFSRPGFVTFKLPEGMRLTTSFDLRSTFARTYGFSLGRIAGGQPESMASTFWETVGSIAARHLHVWQRDAAVPGDHEFEPGPTALSEEVGQILAATRPDNVDKSDDLLVNQEVRAGELVLDCVLVEPNEWWAGFHEATSWPSRWVGGVPNIELAEDMISRSYLKISEALEWSRLPVKAGDHCAEIGSAPGGAAQALLAKGLTVLGVDPAEMDASLLAQAELTHMKKRAKDVKRREFRHVKWLFADSNVAPKYTLDAVEAIVTHREVHVRGMLLTLKLLEWELAEQIPDYVGRIQSWGFEHVQTRQLAFNRREFCVAALKKKR